MLFISKLEDADWQLRLHWNHLKLATNCSTEHYSLDVLPPPIAIVITIKSITVPWAELIDSVATTVFVMEPDSMLKWLEGVKAAKWVE